MKPFNQNEYRGYSFYSCDDEHPFIVFTTCFCPLCEKEQENEQLQHEVSELEGVLDELSTQHSTLVHRLTKMYPEALL